jgi:ElaB/YqjD/DUF883 family membrane-anchored ribosome-binding protein
MEQEVQVNIHSGEQHDQGNKPQAETSIPDLVKEIGESVSETFAHFKESDTWERILQGVETSREYVRKYPGKAIIYTLGAGALFGLLLKKKR